MELIVAKLAGFCFGVERAVEQVYELTKNKNYNIYTLGKLIHNPTIITELEKNNVKIISDNQIDEIYKNTSKDNKTIIIIRAHGISKEINDKLLNYAKENEFFKVSDCTCPHVKKIHKIVSEHSGENTLTLIFGDENHPEVKGICSYVKGDYIVFSDADELDLSILDNKSVTMVSQTTQNLTEWEKSQKIIKKVCTNPLIFDTICSVTENRQAEVDKLSKNVDLMLVIGGSDSSNTNKLYEIARSNLQNTFLIENADQIPNVTVTAHMKVGIAAGASTPGSIIEEVKTKMSEKNAVQTFDNSENFAELLENSLTNLNTGDTVTGIITSVTSNEVHVDIGAKVTGIILATDIIDPTVKLSDLYKVGDQVTAVAVRVSDVDGVATLSRKRIEASENWNSIIDAYKEGKVLEGRVTNVVKGGVIIILNSVKVFVPASQTGIPKNADLGSLVGTLHKVKIIDVNEQRKHAVASISSVLRDERKAAENEFWANLEVGKQFTGKVKSLTSYGAFVNLGPVDGMVHSSELSWRHIKHPSEIVNVGDTLNVFVKEFDAEKKRISLGYKTEETNPWTLFKAQYNVGDVVSVKIVSMMPFGAFAEILPGADGLIHISQIADKKLAKPSDVLEIGQVVDAKITEIDDEKQKISLSIRALIEDAKKAEDAEAMAYIENAAKEENEVQE